MGFSVKRWVKKQVDSVKKDVKDVVNNQYVQGVAIGIGGQALGVLGGAVSTTVGASKIGMQAAQDTDLIQSEQDILQANRIDEDNARAAAVNDAISDRSLDAISREELVQMYQSGQSSGKIAALLAQAREGKGVYGIRRLNQNEAEIQRARQTSMFGGLF